MKLLLLITILNLNTDTIPPTPILLDSLEAFHQKQLQAELTAFDASPKDYWMNFVPSIGVGYNLQGQPRPTLSYSIASLFNFRNQKRQIEKQRQAILLQHQVTKETDQRQLLAMIQEYQLMKSDLIFKTSIFAIDKELFEFYQKQTENLELKPSQFLIKKREFLHKKEQLFQVRQTLKIQKIKILITAHFS